MEVSRVGHFEKLPAWVIDGVEINQHMADGIDDRRLQKWFNPDFLINHAAVFALGRKEGGLKRLQTPTMHRGVLLKLDAPYFDEYGVAYGEIGVKGTGLSEYGVEHYLTEFGNSWRPGNIWEPDPDQISVKEQRSRLTSNSDPLGFFGYYHSQQEQTVSNLFARAGGRTGRVIGTIILNHQRFRLWYEKLIDKDSAYPIAEMLSRVEANGDQAALCVRLMGTERCADFNRSAHLPGDGFYYWGRIQQRAARLLYCEIQHRGLQDFLNRYNLADDLLGDNLLNFIKGHRDWSAYKALLFLQRYFYLWNLDTHCLLSKQKFANQLTIHISPQNVDLAGFVYDWENSLPGPGYIRLSYPEFPSALFKNDLPAADVLINNLLAAAIDGLRDPDYFRSWF